MIDYEKLFKNLPERYVVLDGTVPVFTILAASTQYLKVTGKSRKEIIGKPLFTVFPDTTELAKKTGKGEVVRSIEACIKSKKPDSVGVIRYDISGKNGENLVRYWKATHYPIADVDGTVVQVVQSTTDVTEMVEVDEHLRTAEAQFDEIIATGLVGSWVWDITRDKVIADKGLALFFGMNEKDATEGMSIKVFIKSIHPDDRKKVEKQINGVLKKGEKFECEYRTVDRSGQTRWVIARGKVVRDKKNVAIKFPGVMVDITKRKAAEQALAESEERLRFMADTVPQLVWTSEPDGTIDYYNQRWKDFTGVTLQTASSKERSHVLHPDDNQRVQKAWQYSLETGKSYELEYRLYHAPSDSYKWVIGRAESYCDAKGTIIKWYGTATEIDAQKRASQIQDYLARVSNELAASMDYEATLKKVSHLCVPEIADWCSVELYSEKNGIEQVSVAHVDPAKVSLALEYRQRNPVTIDQPGGVAHVIRSGVSEFYPVISPDMLVATIKNKKNLKFMLSLNLCSIIIAPIKTHDKVIGAISFIASDSGRHYTKTDVDMAEDVAARISLSLMNVKLLNDSNQELRHRRQLEKDLIIEQQKLESRVKERTEQLQLTNAGLRDEIIKRRMIEEELQRNTKELARSNQELQDFAYVASHDLQEPLRKIQAFGDLLESEYSGRLGDGAEYLDRMRAAASRMSTLIEDLLAFSRVSSKAQKAIQVDLSAIVGEVLVDLETRLKEVEGTVEVDTLPSVLADKTHMRQLLQNLISNALKFHKPGIHPKVKVYAKESDDGYADIRVEDNGIGFEMKYLDRIFSVFQRLHGREDYDGTGIGLAVCRKIVERYGGTITAESKKNKGATFIIKLPTRE